MEQNNIIKKYLLKKTIVANLEILIGILIIFYAFCVSSRILFIFGLVDLFIGLITLDVSIAYVEDAL